MSMKSHLILGLERRQMLGWAVLVCDWASGTERHLSSGHRWQLALTTPLTSATLTPLTTDRSADHWPLSWPLSWPLTTQLTTDRSADHWPLSWPLTVQLTTEHSADHWPLSWPLTAQLTTDRSSDHWPLSWQLNDHSQLIIVTSLWWMDADNVLNISLTNISYGVWRII